MGFCLDFISNNIDLMPRGGCLLEVWPSPGSATSWHACPPSPHHDNKPACWLPWRNSTLHGGSRPHSLAFNAYTCTITVSGKMSKLLNIILQKHSNLRGTLQMPTETQTQSSQQMPFSVPPLTITWQGCGGGGVRC